MVCEHPHLSEKGSLVVAPCDTSPDKADDSSSPKFLSTYFYALRPPVDVVAEEEIVGLGREAGQREQSQQIIELAVDVT